MTEEMKYVGLGKRFLALVLDCIIFFIPFYMIDLLIFTNITGAEISEYLPYVLGDPIPEYERYDANSSVIGLMLGIIYFVILVSWLGATPGKLILRMKIVNKHGHKLSFFRALWRYMLTNLSYFTLGISYLMIAWTKKKQGLHDKLASTYVVYK
ncbi:RDD family protein [Litchfieldia salsa]|uniref:Uncharacterized membrane protein YckC, RDD family n=1 Tax=Litchfieldia salsa TaxID=930152 RepID=A0A1H0PXQ0_9BACI|nr:RDD family protein [Litchfieldia salsa]SDP09495.1 Uncharacterized membrane protein YckC, RDD family [Litchfieldia salsa]